MGVKIVDPPNDDAAADAMPNGIVTGAVQAYEATRAQGTHRATEKDREFSDSWFRPWAVRAANSHSMPANPDKMLMRVGPDKFAKIMTKMRTKRRLQSDAR